MCCKPLLDLFAKKLRGKPRDRRTEEQSLPSLSKGKMNSTGKKQSQVTRVPFLLSAVILCTLYQLIISVRLYEPLPMPHIGEGSTEGAEETTAETNVPLTKSGPTDQTTSKMHVEYYSDTTSGFNAPIWSESPQSLATKLTTTQCIHVSSEPPQEKPTLGPASADESPHIKGKYPEERRQGWVILHITGMMYMFISLVTVCNDFFVPALGVITDKLAISEDVAGATFMAGGISAPKLFPLLIGVFIAHSNVGIGTIVGSAVFNILFVIGMCALFSREVLHLTRWPFFRDLSFYILDLILLIIFFLDNIIMWWESLLLVTSYTLYVVFMKFNVQIEQTFKSQLHKHKKLVKVINVEEPKNQVVPAGEDGSGCSEDGESDEDDNTDLSKNENNETEMKEEEEEEKNEKPLSLEWPNTRCKQATYLFLLPIIFPLWLTLPDVRYQKSRKFFVVTFLGSILWIAVLSYFIVWWAHQVGEATNHIMTILAAGMSSPVLLTSMIVARKGLGDMAVSSSVGSNIFDITVGLPVPWLLYTSINGLAPVAVSSDGLFCAIVLLFIMLLFVIISIASCKWKMNKALGFTVFLLYIIFLVLSLMLQYRIIICPVSVGMWT